MPALPSEALATTLNSCVRAKSDAVEVRREQARAASPVTAGVIVTVTGSYVPVFVLLLSTMLLALVAVLRTVGR